MITLSQLRDWQIISNDGTIPSYPGLPEHICCQVIQELVTIVNTMTPQQYLEKKDPRGRKYVVMPDDIIYHLVRKVKDIICADD